jgi:hypothetical protein
MDSSIPLKFCRFCQTDKPITAFNKNPKCHGGRNTKCIECEKAYKREYQRKNTERLKEISRRYAETHREESRAKAKAWYQENKEKATEYRKRYAKEKAQITRARAAKWYKENPDRAKRNSKAGKQRRRARIVNAGGELTATDIKRQYDAQKGRCFWCDI